MHKYVLVLIVSTPARRPLTGGLTLHGRDAPRPCSLPSSLSLLACQPAIMGPIRATLGFGLGVYPVSCGRSGSTVAAIRGSEGTYVCVFHLGKIFWLLLNIFDRQKWWRAAMRAAVNIHRPVTEQISGIHNFQFRGRE